MKTAVVGVGAALAASACCIGPVVFTLLGAGALSAASLKLVPYRPWLIGATAMIIGVGFYSAYRPLRADCSADGACTPQSRRTARVVIWMAAIAAVVLVTFPYYIGWFVE
jgi:mercuric ion transport protein